MDEVEAEAEVEGDELVAEGESEPLSAEQLRGTCSRSRSWACFWTEYEKWLMKPMAASNVT